MTSRVTLSPAVLKEAIKDYYEKRGHSVIVKSIEGQRVSAEVQHMGRFNLNTLQRQMLREAANNPEKKINVVKEVRI